MQLSKEMRPTKRTVFIRQFKIYQLIRFITLDLRILKATVFPPKH